MDRSESLACARPWENYRMTSSRLKKAYRSWGIAVASAIAVMAFNVCRPGYLDAAASTTAAPNGEQLYTQACAKCHSNPKVVRAPQLTVLRTLDAQQVLDALEVGAMRFIGLQHTDQERRLIAEYVTGKKLIQQAEAVSVDRCVDSSANFDPASSPKWNGWGNGLDNARFQSAAASGLSSDQIAKLGVKWAFGLPQNTTISQPTIVGGRVFFGSSRGMVYALDAKTGCLYWTTKIGASVRSATTVAPLPGSNPPRYAVYFGDLGARAHALDATTGAEIWTVQVESHPAARISGAPALYQERLYVPVSSTEEAAIDPKAQCCTFRGSVSALDAATGKKIWQAYTIQQKPHPTRKTQMGTQLFGPAGAGIWSSPTVDPVRQAVYVTTGDNYADPASKTSDAVLAFDLTNGKLLWSRQFTANDAFTIGCAIGDKLSCPEANGPDLDFGSSAILRALPNGKRVLLAGQKSGVIHAVDPDKKGKLLWERRLGRGGVLGGIQWGPAADDDTVYVAISDIETKIHQDPDIGMTTALDNQKGGGLYALDIATGKQRWMKPPAGCGGRDHCSPAQSAAVTAMPGMVFSGSVDGHLRAYSTQEGKVILDFNSAQDFPTVNKVPAKGGSIDGPGATIAGGMLYMSSGYSLWGGLPGNVLLGMSPEGK